MKTIVRYAAVAAVTGAVVLAATAPSEARHWRHGHAALGGFAAGAFLGAAAATAGGYYYAPGYAYGPGYVYEDDSYAYVPARSYRYRAYGHPYDCRVDLGYGRWDYTQC